MDCTGKVPHLLSSKKPPRWRTPNSLAAFSPSTYTVTAYTCNTKKQFT